VDVGDLAGEPDPPELPRGSGRALENVVQQPRRDHVVRIAGGVHEQTNLDRMTHERRTINRTPLTGVARAGKHQRGTRAGQSSKPLRHAPRSHPRHSSPQFADNEWRRASVAAGGYESPR